MRIYFARHGESEANVLREFSNRGMKHGLTANGREQAALLAGRFAGLGIGRVIASPLLRARESAQTLGTRLGVGVEESDALREWDVGVLEGRSDDEGWVRASTSGTRGASFQRPGQARRNRLTCQVVPAASWARACSSRIRREF